MTKWVAGTFAAVAVTLGGIEASAETASEDRGRYDDRETSWCADTQGAYASGSYHPSGCYQG
ncbi:MAG: hypothetical protein HOQ24_16385 [Mycobacteriaceae bacterium]|nr:hypothetical protein [Mycobacteriaceae bacterium]